MCMCVYVLNLYNAKTILNLHMFYVSICCLEQRILLVPSKLRSY